MFRGSVLEERKPFAPLESIEAGPLPAIRHRLEGLDLDHHDVGALPVLKRNHLQPDNRQLQQQMLNLLL